MWVSISIGFSIGLIVFLGLLLKCFDWIHLNRKFENKTTNQKIKIVLGNIGVSLIIAIIIGGFVGWFVWIIKHQKENNNVNNSPII